MLFLSIVRHTRLGRGSPSIPLFHVHRSNLCKCERFHLGIRWSRGPFLQLFVRFHTALKVRQPWWGFLLLGPPTSQFSNLKRCENCVVTYRQCFLFFFFVPALLLGFWRGRWCGRRFPRKDFTIYKSEEMCELYSTGEALTAAVLWALIFLFALPILPIDPANTTSVFGIFGVLRIHFRILGK